MAKPDWQLTKDIFAEALDHPLEDRVNYLREKCGPNEDLYDEVYSLLAASEEPENLIERHAIDLAANVDTDERDYQGQHFGPYTIVGKVGSGGMGTVFLAERDDGEFRKQVALKIVRRSIADQEILARFKRERQILANLTHPNIAALYDGGVSEKGEPFLAMEYVVGESLMDYVAANKLVVAERLNIFLKICSAVHYAHRNLIVHRDIKPSNILVTKGGEPKLLDFGLAKAFETDAAITQTALRAFTPAYASPEQILGNPITTASDVYSLGVILYELLTETKPISFDDKTFDEIYQSIRISEPRKPSSVQGTISYLPNTSSLKGDLDNITLMALRKEPERRYRSVAEFADDIDRHLKRLPIAARPNTSGYLIKKFVQRHKVPVAAAVIIMLSIFTGLGFSLWQADVARRESARSAAVNQFLQKMLLTAIPESKGGGVKGAQATIIDVLGEAEKRLDSEELASEGEVRSQLRQLIGEAYLTQGMYEDARRNLIQALEEQRALYGEESPRTLSSELSLGTLYLAIADYERSAEIFERRFPQFRMEYLQGKAVPEFYVAKLLDHAVACRARGDSERAESLLREAVELADRHDLDFQINMSRSLLALTLLDKGDFDAADRSQSELVSRLRQANHPDDPALASALTLLGSIQMEQGDLENAESKLIEAENLYRKLYGPEYLATYDNIRLQAQVAYLKGNYRDASEKIETVLESYKRNSNPRYISYATALTIKGLVLGKQGNLNEAENLLNEAVRLRTENLPPGHFMTAITKGSLGEILMDSRKYEQAEALLYESLEVLKQTQTRDNARLKLANTRISRLRSEYRKL